MKTIKLDIDKKTKAGKALIKYIKALAKETDWIEIVKEKPAKTVVKKSVNTQILELSREINKNGTHKYLKKLIEK